MDTKINTLIFLALVSFFKVTAQIYTPGSNVNSLLNGSTTNVGVGTNSPDQLFQVHSTNTPTIAIGKLNQNTGGKSRLQFLAGDGSTSNGFSVDYIKSISTDRLAFVDGGGVERMSILNGGHMGLGTINPLSRLTVQSSVGTASTVYPLSIASLAPDAASGSGVGMSFFLGGNSTEAQRAERARITVKQTYFGVRPSFSISTTEYNSPYTAFIDRLTISPLGNVGIGTSNPSDRLTSFVDGALASNT